MDTRKKLKFLCALTETVYFYHLVDLSRGYVVVTSQLDVEKTLIISKVQVHL